MIRDMARVRIIGLKPLCMKTIRAIQAANCLHIDSIRQDDIHTLPLIKVDQNADESEKAKARNTIKEIQQKLEKGEDFAELAKKYSQGPSGPKGGALGYFKRGQMVKPFEDAAFALEINEVSDMVVTTFGYHLILVIDKKPESTMDYEVIKPSIIQYLKQEKTKKEVGRYIEQLRSESEIKLF